MSQKTLFSYFKVHNSDNKSRGDTSTGSNKEKTCSEDDSPVKTKKNVGRKRNRISSSDSESNQSCDELQSGKKGAKDAETKRSVGKIKKTEHVENDNAKLDLSAVKDANSTKKTVENGSSSPITTREGNNEKQQIEEDLPSSKTIINGNSSTASENTGCSKEAFNPNVAKYDPIKNASWNKGEKVPYLALAKTLEEVENVSSRLKMIEILSNYLRSVIVLSPNDLLPSIYLCLNKIGPPHEGKELGLAEQTLIRAISQSTGRTVGQIRSEIQEVGDLGLVAERSRSCQKLMIQPSPLTVSGVFKKFREISEMTGQTAINKKITIIQTLFVACKGPEARFLIRSLNGKLRCGLAENSVLQAIAVACATTPPGQDYPPEILDASKSKSAESFKSEVSELALILKSTYCECPNYDIIMPVLLKSGIRSLPEHCKITPGVPMKPMLAQPTKGVDEVLSRFDGLEFTCEFKYDGERAQIHCTEEGEVKIFSRNQEDHTSKYPDIISRISKAKKEGVKSFILDCEAVAWDAEAKGILPFQVLIKRKRKAVKGGDITVPVCVFMFDILYLNGKSLIKECLFERRRLLRENFNHVDGEWMFAQSMDSTKFEEVQEFLEESVKGNCEGLMVKTLKEDATYEIANRSRNWLKLKKDYLDGVGDTLDLVVLGGYLGKGRRTGTYGGFLVGCYDEDNEEYQSVCKIGTGFSDEHLATHAEFFKNHIITKAPSYYQYDAATEPDHWFETVQVWEVKCADFSLSPIHRAGIGLVDPEKGVSLRFPRFLRIRDDKKPEQGTTARQIIDMYNDQEQIKSQRGKKPTFNEEDFY